MDTTLPVRANPTTPQDPLGNLVHKRRRSGQRGQEWAGVWGPCWGRLVAPLARQAMPCRLNHPAISAWLRGPLAEPAAAERWLWASLPHRSSPPPARYPASDAVTRSLA